MIYLDNSATSGFKPECVKRAAVSCMEHLSANAGRSGHKKSVAAAMLVYRTRGKLADFVGCDGQIAFTGSCTEALNLAILGSVVYGGHVITTVYEHNSVLRPLHELSAAGRITLSVAKPDENGRIGFDEIRRHIRGNTYLVAVTGTSNVTGARPDIDGIARGIKGSKIKLLVDGAQSIGYIPVDMKKTGIDYLAVAPHKGLHALQGVGALCMAKGVLPRPVKFGGTGTQSTSLLQPSEPPECYESGTLPLVAIASLNRALDWTEKKFDGNAAKLRTLQKRLLDSLKEIDGIDVKSGENDSGIVAFAPKNASSEEVCDALDAKYDIAARGGLHCAPLMHKYLGTLESGIVRLSVGCDNTKSDMDETARAIREIVK